MFTPEDLDVDEKHLKKARQYFRRLRRGIPEEACVVIPFDMLPEEVVAVLHMNEGDEDVAILTPADTAPYWLERMSYDVDPHVYALDPEYHVYVISHA